MRKGEGGSGKSECGSWNAEVGMWKLECGSRKWEVGPVVVPKGWDYAAASMRKLEYFDCGFWIAEFGLGTEFVKFYRREEAAGFSPISTKLFDKCSGGVRTCLNNEH